MRKFAIIFMTLLWAAIGTATAEEELLAPDEAFAFSAEPGETDSFTATWDVAEGYYLYRNKIRFETDAPGVTLGEPRFPAGKIKHDEFFGDVETYRGHFSVQVPVERTADAPDTITITAHSQGCADMGVCYPPQRQEAEVTLAATETTGAQTAGGLGGGFGQELFSGGGGNEFLEPDQAFQLATEVVDGNTVNVYWEVAPEHYMYRDKISFALKDADGVRLGTPVIPAGEEKNDEFFGLIQVFHNRAQATVPLVRDKLEPTAATLVVGYQGCAEAGICYPPIKKEVALKLPAGTAAGELTTGSAASSEAAAANAGAPLSEQDSLAQQLASGNTLIVLLTFLGLGLLLAFTPCVFPMIPILSSIIVGQGEGLTTRRAFTLSLVYVLAMAATYTVAGVVAGLFGANVQAAFQNPWVLSAFAAIFVALATSMFGFYELQLPSSWQSRLSEISNRQQGGTLIGVGVMGLLSALIVGPCVAPPLMGALIYIGQTGDPWLGGSALFALSLGMGAPLLAIGTAGGKFLPRAGGWMDAVKAVFGLLLLAVAIWMLERILPPAVTMQLWTLLAIGSAIYMGTLKSMRNAGSTWKGLWQGLRLVLLAYGVVLLIGSVTGGRDPLAPLAHLEASEAAGVEFTRLKSVEDLNRELARAKAQGQPVMLDFYADWCVSCKEFEKYTFSDPKVMDALSGARLLQADVTANDAQDKALLRRFNLIGPPGILFWNAEGQEQRNYRVVGFMPADEFAPLAAKAAQ